MAHEENHPAPHSTVHRFIQTCLPSAVRRVLFSQSEDFPVAHLVFRALFGAASGTVLFLCIGRNLPLTFDLKVAVGCLFVAVCVAGGLLSSSFRCTVLLVFPGMLGSQGRSLVMLLTLSVLYTGPVSNIQRNVEAAALSVSCNLDLQVRHSRLLWREAVKPFLNITQELMDDKADFQLESLNVSRKFQDIRDEIVLQYGYDRFETKRGGNSTQEEFTAKTLKQCDSVVDQGAQRCADWFANRWTTCMETIPVPVINHILCVSMKFDFLCDITRVMTPWCRENIPVEGNFGQFFDQLNVSVDQLSGEFSAELAVEEEEQQPVLGGAPVDQTFTDTVKASFQKLTSTMGRVLDILQLLLSFTFIIIFTQAFGYLRHYRRDIFFDNVYINSYFREIDARRQKAGKRFLLPLKKSEKKKLIDPRSLKMYPGEVTQVISGVFQVLTVSLLSVVLLTVDFSLFHVLDIISRHTFTQFNVTSSHQFDIRVGGDTMMARLLRTTISAFNSSSSLNIQSDNQECMSPPSMLSAEVYVSCVCCILLMVLLSCLQVYTNRLRRVIAAFYNPEREKTRIVFLYHLQIHERISPTGRKSIIGRGQRIRTLKNHMVHQRSARNPPHIKLLKLSR